MEENFGLINTVNNYETNPKYEILPTQAPLLSKISHAQNQGWQFNRLIMFRNPLGHFNLLTSFQMFSLPNELTLSYLHSTLLGHWFGELSILLYQEIRYDTRSDTVQSQIDERLSLERRMKEGWENQLTWEVWWIQQNTEDDLSPFWAAQRSSRLV